MHFLQVLNGFDYTAAIGYLASVILIFLAIVFLTEPGRKPVGEHVNLGKEIQVIESINGIKVFWRYIFPVIYLLFTWFFVSSISVLPAVEIVSATGVTNEILSIKYIIPFAISILLNYSVIFIFNYLRFIRAITSWMVMDEENILLYSYGTISPLQVGQLSAIYIYIKNGKYSRIEFESNDGNIMKLNSRYGRPAL